ncbi:MAG: cytochrome c oxidase subunit 3 [Bacteroidota bacterium]|jgi:cytochrome c oxidase subunit 3|nr:cytochrome c oxidase subunit 3 [Bacteroidota bacterium]
MNRQLHIDIAEEPMDTLAMHPKKFALWLFIVSIIMIFAALTSAYIVKQGEGNWLVFEMPLIFWINSAVILASSVTMQLAYYNTKKNNLEIVKIFTAITTILGLAFLVLQVFAWEELVKMGVYFVGNPSGSFLYVLTGMHGFHLITGLIYLIILLTSTYKYKVHSKSMVQMEMCTTYWHFLDGLWIYLFMFLLLNN